MWSSPLKTPGSRYATLGGEQLPLFQRSSSPTTPLVRVRDVPLRFGQRARLTPRLLLTGCGLVSLIVLVNVLLWRLLAAHDENDADLSFAQREHGLRAAGGPHGFLAMSDDEALEAMYPPTAERVPKSHSGEQPASACESRFTLLLVADQDRETPRANGSWHSTLRRGSLCLRTPTAHDAAPSFSVSWVDEVPLTSPLNAGGRGMELSELVWYAGRLLTCDDHTGIVYEIKGGRVVPAYILADGDGHAARSFKCEWAAVRHGLLYVGGLGRAWPEPQDDEAFAPRMHTDTPMWVKVLDGAAVRHANWAANYAAMREAANCSGAGYLSHEAALWDDGTDRWLFMPRRASSEAWGEAEDEQRGANLMLWSHGGWDPHLQGLHPAQASGHHHHPARPQVRVERVQGPLLRQRGFSSVKLLPGTEMLVALKTEEVRGRFASYLTVLTLNGSVLMEDTHVKDVKYEGLEVAV